MDLQTELVDVGLGAEGALVGLVTAVQALVQLEMDVLGELGGAQLALVGFFT